MTTKKIGAPLQQPDVPEPSTMMLLAGGSCLSFHEPIRGFALCADTRPATSTAATRPMPAAQDRICMAGNDTRTARDVVWGLRGWIPELLGTSQVVHIGQQKDS